MRNVFRAAIVVFTASFCTLVIELVAGRILAPFVGVSLYTWTSIIGVVLAGISAGAWAGGWLADRRPRPSTLGWLLLAAGAAALLIAPATALLAPDDGLLAPDDGLLEGIATTLMTRVVLLAFLLFFVPSFLLGMISPVAVKLAVRDLDTAGSVVGRLYALSTLGSIAGTFATGFYFVANFGTRATLTGVGVALIASALLFGDLLGRRSVVAAIVVVAAAASFIDFPERPPPQDTTATPTELGELHFEESAYYTIRVEQTVRDDTGAPIHALHLDHLVHSYGDPADPAYLEYGYERMMAELLDARIRPASRVLFIGGGGYTLPRLLELRHPMTQVDVVEIDPAVTRTAHRFFGLPRDTAIRTINEDARWFAMHAREPYDVILIDAFNDLSVPYHLTTREFAAELRRLLRPGGLLMVNLIDNYEEGRFLASYMATLGAVFPHVSLLIEGPEDFASERSTFVVVATAGVPPLSALPPVALRAYLARRRAIVLTDDHAPVDNMLAPLFAERFADESE